MRLAPRTAVSVQELFAINAGRDPTSARLHQEQAAALMRMLPVSLVVNMINAFLVAWTFWDYAPRWQLTAWKALVFGYCISRAISLIRLRDPLFAATHSRSHRRVVCLSVGMAVLWLAPALLWFELAAPPERIVIGILLAGMMCGGSIILSVVPVASLAYVIVLAAGAMVMGHVLRSPELTIMIVVFAGALCAGSINNARLFIGHVKAQLELEEKAELIGLLREFDASGSEWLWELGPDLQVKHVSSGLALALGQPMSAMIGRSASDLLDPSRQVATVSAGMRAILDSLNNGQAFRDIAIPALNGRAWWSLSGKPTVDSAGHVIGWRGVGSDITDSRLTGQDSITAARHDVMTGLANRLLIRELLEEALLRRRSGRTGCAMMVVDLDRFKLVNDTLGHEVGDALLCEVARRLERVVPAQRVGRLGGDEFALVLTGKDGREELAALAQAVIATLSAPYRIGLAELNIGATIGIAVAPSDGITQEALTRSADLALYSAKNAGRGGFNFFAPWMAEQAAANRALESDLRSALQAGELSLAYQPIVDARSHRIIAREALLRWTHPVRGEVPPDLFVPVIEDAGLIGQVGNWVLREACAEAAAWADDALVAVNVSSAQLAAGPALVGHVIHALAASGLPAGRLELEVTESIFLAGDSTTRTTLEQLNSLGVRLVLDDFGMGYSSYSCLTNGEFSKLKIDRSFTAAAVAPGCPAERAIIESILTLARGLNLEVTAEGIETPEQAALMVSLGCGQLQGYLYGRPEIPHSSTRRIEEPRRLPTPSIGNKAA